MVVAQERYDHYSLPEEEGRVIRRPKPNRLPGKGTYNLSLLVLLTFCTGMLIAYYYSQVMVSGYKISSLNNQLATLRQETVSLSEEVDRLNSLGRIEYLATNKLKMVKPDSKDVVVVKANLAVENSRGRPAGAAGPPSAAAGPGAAKGDQQVRSGQDTTTRSKVVQAFANLIGIKGS